MNPGNKNFENPGYKNNHESLILSEIVKRIIDNPDLGDAGEAIEETLEDLLRDQLVSAGIIDEDKYYELRQLLYMDDVCDPRDQEIMGLISRHQTFMDQIYDQNNSGDREYTLRQTFTINSENVSAITELSKNTQALIQKGVIFSTQSLEYYYSKLSEARVALMANAVKDARARAESLAESVGKKIGDLKSASSGVVQVLPPNSLEISDYGTYDTSTVDKQIMLTVRASFTLN